MKTLAWRQFALSVVLTLSFFVAQTGAHPAKAVCARALEAGSWHNADPATATVTRIQIRQFCADNPPNVESDYGYGLQLWGACQPVECYLGSFSANRDSTRWIRFSVHYGYATKHFWVAAYDSSRLRVYIWTDFTAADGRVDFASNDWFYRD
jgi:hypothetical protein